MDITTQLEEAIQTLKDRKADLEEQIREDTEEQEQLEAYMKEVLAKKRALQDSLATSNEKLKELVSAINESENGYQKILTAGQTLMDIVAGNVKSTESPEKID